MLVVEKLSGGASEADTGPDSKDMAIVRHVVTLHFITKHDATEEAYMSDAKGRHLQICTHMVLIIYRCFHVARLIYDSSVASCVVTNRTLRTCRTGGTFMKTIKCTTTTRQTSQQHLNVNASCGSLLNQTQHAGDVWRGLLVKWNSR